MYIPTGTMYGTVYLSFFYLKHQPFIERWIYNRPWILWENLWTFPHGRTLRSWWPRRFELTDIFPVSWGGQNSSQEWWFETKALHYLYILISFCICIVQTPFEEEGSEHNLATKKFPRQTANPAHVPQVLAPRVAPPTLRAPQLRKNFRDQNLRGPSWRNKLPKTHREPV